MQHFTSYISFTMRVYTSANSTAANPDPAHCPSAIDLHAVCQAVSRHLCRAVLRMIISAVDKIRKELIQI
jgi:hypothetical protein